ncbi:MAG: beta-N-acetylhexosaminidase [Rhodospirillales bacterium]
MADALTAPAVFGCAGPALSPEERSFFREANPLGFILFQRNCTDPDQVRTLVDNLRACVGRADAPVLIDQEGGRVARLKPPHWRAAPAPGAFAALAQKDPERAVRAARLNARLMAAELADLGITVDCTPVLDIPRPGADPIIGDRALGDAPETVARLGRAVCEGLLDGGVLPVIKHIPGHGRAPADSHKTLPVVETGIAALRESDFAPFKALRDIPWAMTAHVLYTDLDSAAPATTSKTIIGDIIRGEIGFQGVLVSDDLSMRALAGDFRERAAMSLAAGCDIVLHCNGDRAEMEAVMTGCGAMGLDAILRLQRAESVRTAPGGGERAFDRAEALSRFDHLMEAVS